MTETTDFAIVNREDSKDAHAGSDVPGEFCSLTSGLGCTQLAATLIRVHPHLDFERGTGHFHDFGEASPQARQHAD